MLIINRDVKQKVPIPRYHTITISC